jgi:hypothetical protein
MYIDITIEFHFSIYISFSRYIVCVAVMTFFLSEVLAKADALNFLSSTVYSGGISYD